MTDECDLNGYIREKYAAGFTVLDFEKQGNLQAIGPEFKNFRKYLLDNLPGNKAWKHGRPNA